MLEAESIPAPYCARKDYVNKNSSDTIENRTRNLPACRAVPQPTAPSRAPKTEHVRGNSTTMCDASRAMARHGCDATGGEDTRTCACLGASISEELLNVKGSIVTNQHELPNHQLQ